MAKNPGIVASYRNALSKKGVAVLVTRENGFAPNIATFSAAVTAMVQDYQPDTTSVAQTGYATTKMGAVTEGDRMLIVMADDLAAMNFPLPLKKNDKVSLLDDAGKVVEVLNIISTDASKRAAAGAIELKAAGVS